MNFQTDHILYGGDYNPDQWLDRPDILETDIKMMKKAGINCVSMAMFSWALLEPEEGHFEFEWMKNIVNHLYENGIYTILSTPSGARPRWLAERYPEVLRMNADRSRMIFGGRHNHCLTSPVYRKKVRMINQKLAEQFDSNPAVILWHISNEYGGECHCPMCQQAFGRWLEKKYHKIGNLNRAWNTAFWSHTYDNFSQAESPSELGEMSILGLRVDWKRFVSDQTIDFAAEEIRALRDAGAKKPVTTNMMYQFDGINYYDLAKILDVISWDNYPAWGHGDYAWTAADNAMQHDFMRSLKKAPYLMMESCPGATNWQPVSRLKRPGVLMAQSIQAIAHGSDSVQYFQIRKGPGGAEKFHGAVIDHYGKEDDRTYQECKNLGEQLKNLSELAGTVTPADCAVICDVENKWALEASAGPRNCGLDYMGCVKKSYMAFRKQGLNVDVITQMQPLDSYKIVAAPMSYMFRPGFADRVRSFVEQGGIFILTYWSGVVDENDRCILGGTPGGLMDVMGLRSTEIDALYDGETNTLISEKTGESYFCERLCQLVKESTAKTLMTYGQDFYAGTPALTENSYGAGKAYYLCADAEQRLYDDFYRKLTEQISLTSPVKGEIPYGMEITTRKTCDGRTSYLFMQNFRQEEITYIPEIADAELIFGQAEKMNPDGEISYITTREEKGFLPFETRIYRKRT